MIVDPIDGTEFLIRGMPYCVNQAALIHNGEPILGIIHNIFTGQQFIGKKDGGAYCDGEALRPSIRPRHRSIIYYNGDRVPVEPAGSSFVDALVANSGIRGALQLAASGFEATQVAMGKVEGQVINFAHGHPYDYAAGAVLMQAAGVKIATVGLPTYDYLNTRFVAAHTYAFDGLKQFMDKALRQHH